MSVTRLPRASRLKPEVGAYSSRKHTDADRREADPLRARQSLFAVDAFRYFLRQSRNPNCSVLCFTFELQLNRPLDTAWGRRLDRVESGIDR
jgi:hypothetical protein